MAIEVFGNEKCRIGRGESIHITHETTICLPGMETIHKKTTTEIVVQGIVDQEGRMVEGGKMAFSVVRRGAE